MSDQRADPVFVLESIHGAGLVFNTLVHIMSRYSARSLELQLICHHMVCFPGHLLCVDSQSESVLYGQFRRTNGVWAADLLVHVWGVAGLVEGLSLLWLMGGRCRHSLSGTERNLDWSGA